MFNRTLLAFRNNPTLRTTFLALFGVVFVLVLGSSFLLAFLAPEQYSSTARIKVERTATENTPGSYQGYVAGNYDPYIMQTHFELIQSESVLGRVAKKLNLAESWGKTSAGAAALSEADTIKLLKQRVDLRPVRNTGLFEVRVFSKNPKEASIIANVLVETYREFRGDYRRSTAGVEGPSSRSVESVEIVDTAVPGLRPVRPNKPFTLFLGLFGGILSALVVGGAGAFLVVVNRRVSPPPAAMA